MEITLKMMHIKMMHIKMAELHFSDGDPMQVLAILGYKETTEIPDSEFKVVYELLCHIIEYTHRVKAKKK